MNFGKAGCARVALGFSILSGAPCAADSVSGTPQQALLVALTESHTAEHFEACGAAPRLRLNEVCGVGTECDEDVRIADFVEVYNPAGQAAQLSCYAIANDEDRPFVPRGQLEPSAVRAWGEDKLGFRIAKKGDQVTLYRMRVVAGKPGLEELDRVEISATRALAYRSPDGGSWVTVPVPDAEWERPASFDRPNP